MNFRTFTVTKDDNDRRIDRIARRFLPEMSLSGIYKLLRKGMIRVDGKKVAPDFHVFEGNGLEIAQPLLESVKISEKPAISGFSPEILLETPDLLFINKPSGIQVHGEGGLDRLIPQTEESSLSLSFRTGPLHRLDKDTTGILTFSRSLEGAQWFSKSIGDRLFEKYYFGVAEGLLSAADQWEDVTEDGKNMITRVQPLAWIKNSVRPLTLVRYRIITGRKHQIRKQSSLRGHPLLGDTRYGSPETKGTYFLHASLMKFPEERPAKIPEILTAPLPERFHSFLLETFGADTLAQIGAGDLYC
jgi:23S rRNA pseudouridine955/2504/2580 synthase